MRVFPLMLLLCACVPKEEAATGAPSAIVGSSALSDHPGVVAVVSQLSGGIGVCTGALIGPTSVLTARHCVNEGAGPVSPEKHEVRIGPSVLPSDVASGVAQTVGVIRVMSYNNPASGLRDFWGDDIAMLELAAPLPVEPVSYRCEPLTDGDVGRALTLVGYGTSGPGQPLGVQRSLETQVGAVQKLVIRPVARQLCHGDSGGPGFVDGQLVGVISSGFCGMQDRDDSLGRIDDNCEPFIEPFLEGRCAEDAVCVGNTQIEPAMLREADGGMGDGAGLDVPEAADPPSGCAASPALPGVGLGGWVTLLLGLCRRRR